jgi:hypothetical protein
MAKAIKNMKEKDICGGLVYSPFISIHIVGLFYSKKKYICGSQLRLEDSLIKYSRNILIIYWSP